ncbi:MAG TPA: hypothetical protein VD997_00875 [Phycisphaerales bacterium]|nr:hypothetical protein [Phycisphaerales bacterium]
MQQVRIFIGKEDEVSRLTKEVNDFLANTGAKVVNVFGNLSPQTPGASGGSEGMRAPEGMNRRFAPSDIMLVVVYQQ